MFLFHPSCVHSSRKEKERRLKAAKKAEKEALKTQTKAQDDASGPGDADKNIDGKGEPKEKSVLAEVMMKWTETGGFFLLSSCINIALSSPPFN